MTIRIVGARKLPEILSREEVARLFNGVANRKHRVLLRTTCAAGLRVSEVTRLRLGEMARCSASSSAAG